MNALEQQVPPEAIEFLKTHAKPNCKWCFSTGEVIHYERMDHQLVRVAHLCNCVVKRYSKYVAAQNRDSAPVDSVRDDI